MRVLSPCRRKPVVSTARWTPAFAGVALAGIVALAACARTGPAPVSHFGAGIASPAGVATVQRGDTIWRISQRYRLPLRDIIDINELSPPYEVKAGQRLKLPPPVDYTVRGHDTLHGVARMFSVPVSELVKTNQMDDPYRLRPGQVLRIPSSLNRQEEARVVAEQQPGDMMPMMPAPPSSRLPAVVAEELPPPSAPASPVPPSVAAQSLPSSPSISAPSAKGFIWPVRGKVVSGYGAKPGGLYNDGINIAVPGGTPVAAAADGVVAYVGDALDSYGNLVLVRHPGGMVTAYAHLSSVSVHTGMRVGRGQTIGATGATGAVDTPQLHFEIRRGTATLDPAQYLG